MNAGGVAAVRRAEDHAASLYCCVGAGESCSAGRRCTTCRGRKLQGGLDSLRPLAVVLEPFRLPAMSVRCYPVRR